MTVFGSRLLLLSAILFFTGCEEQAFQNCDFGQPRHLNDDDIAHLDDLDLVTLKNGYRAVWSTPNGTFGALLSASGKVTRKARRIADRCDGGLDQGPHTLACARTGVHAKNDNGTIVIFDVEQLKVARRRSIGRTGVHPKGVSISEEGATAIAWHEGAPGKWQTWWQVGDADAMQLSTPHLASGEPQVAFNDGEHRVVWAEFWGNVHSQVMTASLRSGTKRIAQTRHDFPRPRIIANNDDFVVSYDDQKFGEKRPGVRVIRVDTKGRVKSKEKWLGPSTGHRGSSLTQCNDYIVSLSPINWTSKEMPVNVHILGDDLTRAFPRQQIYSHEARFPQMDASCTPGNPLIAALVQEAQRETKKPGSVQIQVLNCPLVE